MDDARADLLLGSPLGRRFLACYLDIGGVPFEHGLFDKLGLGQVPGTALLTRRGARLRQPRQPRRWQDVDPDEVRAAIGAAGRVARSARSGRARAAGRAGVRHLSLRVRRRR